jgi:CheY-like chemotaxis protein
VKRLLELSAGFEVRTGINGKEALDALVAAFTAGCPPHIAVIDMSMPVMSGPEATRAFREWEQAHLPPGAPRLPVLCLTANVLEEHAAECAAAGMDTMLTKPLRADALAGLRARAATYAAALTASSYGKRMAADDDGGR